MLACAACAETPARLTSAIVGGSDDDADPGVVALLDHGAVACSGTLVSARAVVTAAHCLLEPPQTVFFGADPALGGGAVPVADVRPHPDYDEVSGANDIGMLALAGDGPAVPSAVFAGPLDDSFIGMPLRLVGF